MDYTPRLFKPPNGSPDIRDGTTGCLWVDEMLQVDLGNLTRECLIARRLFFLDSSRRDTTLGEANWFNTKETT